MNLLKRIFGNSPREVAIAIACLAAIPFLMLAIFALQGVSVSIRVMDVLFGAFHRALIVTFLLTGTYFFTVLSGLDIIIRGLLAGIGQ